MSAFIPMVSTTPPPIDDDDDDFGDFMDGGVDENDDFADFSSPKEFDDFSYPSHNPSSDNVNSLDQETNNEDPSINVHAFNKEPEDDSADQEVKNVMTNHHRDNSTKPGIVESESESAMQVSCNGSTVDDDWFQSDNDDPPTTLSQDNRSNEPRPNDQTNFSEDSVSSNDEDVPENETNVENFSEPRAHISEQTFELKNENFPENNDVIENTRDDFAASESTVTQVEKTPGADKQEDSLCDDQWDIEKTGSISASPEFMPDGDSKGDSDLHDNGKTGVPQLSLDSVEVENSENTSLSRPEFVSNTSDHEKTEKQIPPEFVEIEAGAGYPDFNVEQQDSDGSSQTSINSSHVIDDPLSKSQSNHDIPANSVEDLPFQPDFGNTDEEDDFADFGSFDTQPFNEPENEQSREPTDMEFNAFESNTALADHDDGFADFSTAGTNEVAHDNDDFGGFATTDDDDFGDFDSNSTNWAGFSDTVKKKPTLHEKVDSFVSRYTIEMTEDVDAQIPHLDEHLISDTLSKDVESPSMASVESAGIVWPGDLWDQLEDIDNTIALSFVWNGSYHNKYLLDALGMRTQNILFSGTKQAYYVPTYYAAALGMVDPSKGVMKPMSAAEKITAMSPTEKNFPVVGEVSPEESHPEWKTIADEQTSGQDMTVASSWLHSEHSVCNQDDSEIISKPVPILSSALDLDYFDNLPTATENPKFPGGTDLIDPELLEVTSAPSTEPPPPPKDPANATLSKILASIKGDSNSTTLLTTQYSQHQDNSKWVDEENKLSAEARSVLQKLPDLSYMQSKVLIFPMNMSRMTIGEE